MLDALIARVERACRHLPAHGSRDVAAELHHQYQQIANPSNPSSSPAFCPSALRWDVSAPEEIQGSCVVLLDGGLAPAANKDGP